MIDDRVRFAHLSPRLPAMALLSARFVAPRRAQTCRSQRLRRWLVDGGLPPSELFKPSQCSSSPIPAFSAAVSSLSAPTWMTKTSRRSNSPSISAPCCPFLCELRSVCQISRLLIRLRYPCGTPMANRVTPPQRTPPLRTWVVSNRKNTSQRIGFNAKKIQRSLKPDRLAATHGNI